MKKVNSIRHFGMATAMMALAAIAAEASNSRIYAGLHYRFDVDAGRDLGRAAARIALDRQSLEPARH